MLRNRHIMRAGVFAVIGLLGVMLYVAMHTTQAAVGETEASPITQTSDTHDAP